MIPKSPGIDHDAWQRQRLESDISQFQSAAKNATVKEVDVPDGRKDVRVKYTNGLETVVEEGVAIGVYREYEGQTLVCIHIDWSKQSQHEGLDDRTTIQRENLLDLQESDYYMEGDDG